MFPGLFAFGVKETSSIGSSRLPYRKKFAANMNFPITNVRVKVQSKK